MVDIGARLISTFGAGSTRISRSATPGLAAVALCRSAAVGIDVERVRPELVDDDLTDLALHPQERAAAGERDPEAFFAIWTRKEAALKALGVGLAIAPDTVIAGHRQFEWIRLAFGAAGFVRVRSINAPLGFCAAVATLGAATDVFEWTVGPNDTP